MNATEQSIQCLNIGLWIIERTQLSRMLECSHNMTYSHILILFDNLFCDSHGGWILEESLKWTIISREWRNLQLIVAIMVLKLIRHGENYIEFLGKFRGWFELVKC